MGSGNRRSQNWRKYSQTLHCGSCLCGGILWFGLGYSIPSHISSTHRVLKRYRKGRPFLLPILWAGGLLCKPSRLGAHYTPKRVFQKSYNHMITSKNGNTANFLHVFVDKNRSFFYLKVSLNPLTGQHHQNDKISALYYILKPV
jgi:hypothetical protein